jgi:translation initiation factor IF-2
MSTLADSEIKSIKNALAKKETKLDVKKAPKQEAKKEVKNSTPVENKSNSKEMRVNKQEQNRPNNNQNKPQQKSGTNNTQPHSNQKNDQNKTQGNSNYKGNNNNNKGRGTGFQNPNNRYNKRGKKGKKKYPTSNKPAVPARKFKELPEVLIYTEGMNVADIAKKIYREPVEIIKKLFMLGVMVNQNQPLDKDTIEILAADYGINAEEKVQEDVADIDKFFEGDAVNEDNLVNRPPVVTIMGHVDHGKTTLLDTLRNTKVSLGEAGGITQHIGAYHVETPKGMVTFLDTPGHAAFTAMRARGAKVTDIVVLVVAADDGVMPQTVEAIQHAKAANVPIVVAVNKIDKPEADPEKIKTELTRYELIPEDWGGQTMFIPVSAKTGVGIDELLDSLLVQAEVLELTAPVDGQAQGIVVESRLDKGFGPVATVLVQRGTLHKGDILLAGVAYGRVRALRDENGQTVMAAGPSMPVEVLGLSTAPNAGEEAVAVVDERKAREIAMYRESKAREAKLAQQRLVKTEDIFGQLGEGDIKVLNIVLKADVQGSAEALQDALLKLSTDEVKVKLVGTGVGCITESDVNLAFASKAIILGFNVRADSGARRLVEQEGIIMHYHSIIYDLITEVKNALNGMLSPEVQENIIGLAQVREVFRSAKLGAIAGCMVLEGVVRRNNPIRVLRDNVVIHEGELTSLRRFKDDASEVRHGMECGMGVKNYTDVRAGDQIEVYERVTVARTV